MKRALLTSSGFETQEVINAFFDLVGKKPEEIKALFIPTAANNVDAINILPKCLEDLLKIGIPAKNIAVFDLHKQLTLEELKQFDTIYFTGGSTGYLVKRINETGFNIPLTQYVNEFGVYIGVSAGTIAASTKMPGGLGIIDCSLGVHSSAGTPKGVLDIKGIPHFNLEDNSAIIIRGEHYEKI